MRAVVTGACRMDDGGGGPPAQRPVLASADDGVPSRARKRRVERCPCALSARRAGGPLEHLQTRTTPSSPAVTSLLPSSLEPHRSSRPASSTRIFRGPPRPPASQIRTTPSAPAVATRLPSGLKSGTQHRAQDGLSTVEVPLVEIPDPGRAIVTGADGPCAVRAEPSRPDELLVAAQHRDRCPRRRPGPMRTVPSNAGSNEPASVGAELHRRSA